MIKTQDISHDMVNLAALAYCSTICINVIEIKYHSILQYLQITRLFLSKSDAYREQFYSVKEAPVVHSASGLWLNYTFVLGIGDITD